MGEAGPDPALLSPVNSSTTAPPSQDRDLTHTVEKNTLFSVSYHTKDTREGKGSRQMSKLFFPQHRGEKEAHLFPFWLAFLPFVPLSRGEGAEINAFHFPSCSCPLGYVGPDNSCPFCEQFGDWKVSQPHARGRASSLLCRCKSASIQALQTNQALALCFYCDFVKFFW